MPATKNIFYYVLMAYGSLLKRLKPNVGLTKLAFNAFTNFCFHKIDQTQYAAITYGASVLVDVNEYHGRILWLTGSNDWKVSRVVCALSKNQSLFLDIGANYASIGIAAAHFMRKDGIVHLFEPQPKIADRVEQMLHSAKNGVAVRLHRIALYDKDAVLDMRLCEHHSGLATIAHPLSERKNVHTLPIEAKDTQKFVRPLVNGKFFGVKMDIEGAEPAVLPGLLALGGMKFCVFEGDRNQAELFKTFTAHNYAIYGLERTLWRTMIRRVELREDFDFYHDFVAIKKPVPDPARLSIKDLRRLAADWPSASSQ